MDALELLQTLINAALNRTSANANSLKSLKKLLWGTRSREPEVLCILSIYGESDRQILADIYQQAARDLTIFPKNELNKRAKSHSGTTLITACLRYQKHDKVPRDEQFATTACALMAMQQAAFAQGLEAIWRTGWPAQSDYVREQFKCSEDDECVGFLYVGTPAVPTPIKPGRTICLTF